MVKIPEALQSDDVGVTEYTIVSPSGDQLAYMRCSLASPVDEIGSPSPPAGDVTCNRAGLRAGSGPSVRRRLYTISSNIDHDGKEASIYVSLPVSNLLPVPSA